MASCISTITDEERRWTVIGVCLSKVVAPALRNVLSKEMPKWHHDLCQPPAKMDRQTYRSHLKYLNPSTVDLNYKNINNNISKVPRLFDYAVKDPLSLAKLFVEPFMCKFTGFDDTVDISTALTLIREAAPFTTAAAHAKTVLDSRNEWAHCNFANWTEAKFKDVYDGMETLLKNVNLLPDEEQKLCDELKSWKDRALMYSGQPSDNQILALLREKFDELCTDVKTLNLEKEKITALESDLKKKFDDLGKEVTENTALAKTNAEKIELFRKKVDKLPYIFNPPLRNRYFTGRTKEIDELKRILKFEETLNEKKVRVAAVCGLGGIGKTSLVAEYAHQMKDFYKGGVYWFSAEDDTFLEKSVDDIAFNLDLSPGSFDLNLSNVQRKISTTTDPCLIVLDCLDQLELTSNMMKFLFFPSETRIFGHFVVMTRRNPKLLSNEVSVFEEGFCLQLECFQSEEANRFLIFRTEASRNVQVDSDAESICKELERLPLALEQVGACIKMLGCSFSSYLEEYKEERERLKLLSEMKAQSTVSPHKQSAQRLAVHTTWSLNMRHIRKSPNGEEAVRFLNACSFFNRSEIEEELINVGKPEVEDSSYREYVSLPLGSRKILKLLTDFSLFAYINAQSRSVSTHRLVQELLKESLKGESKAKSFTDAVRMLSFAFAKCSSPSNFVEVDEKNGEEQTMAISELQQNPCFYMWSKFCIHGHQLCRSMEEMFGTIEKVCLDPLWFPETAKILYECAIHLSANQKHEDAKRTLNFGYRILDWLDSKECATVKTDVSNNSLFPLRIPLPKQFQAEIKRFCSPPIVCYQGLTEQPFSKDGEVGSPTSEKDGNKRPKVRSRELYEAHSSTIDLDQDPDCWKDYAEKAFALNKHSNEKVSAQIAAALAFYHNRKIFSDYFPFKESFLDLQDRIFICRSVDELREAIYSRELQHGVLKFLLLESLEYVLKVETFAEAWDNCVLVGTKKNCSVSLTLDGNIDLLKCMLVNLSFYFHKGQLNCLAGSFVKLLHCNFTSDGGEDKDAVTTRGNLNAEQCNFEDSQGGGLSCFGPANVVVADCFFRRNGLGGLVVAGENGNSPKCDLNNSDILYNGMDGIKICETENPMVIHNTNVYCNAHSGVYIQDAAADITENQVFDNNSWGIFSKGNSPCNISMNRIFRNKNGGIRLGFEQEEGKTVPTVVKKNEIYDNDGPGFVNVDIVDNPQPSNHHDNKLHNNVESEDVGRFDFFVPYCSNCCKKSKLNGCEKCFTAAYCNEICQEGHLSKHKMICGDLREKSSYLITSMETAGDEDMLGLEGREEIDRGCGPPPRDGTRFIVKVFNVYTHEEKESTLVLYDRSLDQRVKFKSFVITELVREFGVMCDRKSSEKELFLYCMFDGNSQLRLITSEFAEFQNW